MAILVILGLIVLWGAVLLPPILRSRNASGLGGVSNFTDSLRSLGRGQGVTRGPARGGPVLHGPVGGVPFGSPDRPAPRIPGLPAPVGTGGMTPMQRRRRNVLVGLGGTTGLLFLVALVAGAAIVWLLFLVALAALGGYVYLLVQFKKSSALGGGRPARPVGPAGSLRSVTPPSVDDGLRGGDNVVVLRRNVG